MSAPFDEALAQLGLRADADARSVRRAYAQQLKRLDQATQPREFQALREAYELALHVISRREAEAAQMTSQVDLTQTQAAGQVVESPQPLTATPVDNRPQQAASGVPVDYLPPDSAEVAKAVFQSFASRAAAGFKDEPDATAALQDALADDRLLNLEARTLFELQVAHLIMGGWQPGHEFLFGPTCEVFSWEKDRAHLRVFGQLGAALDAAINEKLIFFRQSPKDFELQRSVIRRLRQTEAPSVKQRRADLPVVQMLVQRHPHWLRLVASQTNINSWFNDLPEPTPATASQAQTQVSDRSARHWKPTSTLTPWWLFVLGLVFMLGKLLSTPTPSYRPLPDVGRPQVTLPSGPPITTWPPESSLGPSTDTSLGSTGSREPKPLYDLPPTTLGTTPRERPAAAPAPAPLSLSGPAIETAHRTPATPIPPESPVPDHPVSAVAPAASEAALPPIAPVRETKPPVDKARIGHVTFALRDGQIVVDEVGERTRYSFGTLQAGDKLLGCMSSDHKLPLVSPHDARYCLTTINVSADAGVTVYMFRVLRYGIATPASLSVRDKDYAPAPRPAKDPLSFGSPG
ncbi:MAG TPA: hypothetical protein VIN58_15815 [Roseateles sp.]